MLGSCTTINCAIWCFEHEQREKYCTVKSFAIRRLRTSVNRVIRLTLASYGDQTGPKQLGYTMSGKHQSFLRKFVSEYRDQRPNRDGESQKVLRYSSADGTLIPVCIILPGVSPPDMKNNLWRVPGGGSGSVDSLDFPSSACRVRPDYIPRTLLQIKSLFHRQHPTLGLRERFFFSNAEFSEEVDQICL